MEQTPNNTFKPITFMPIFTLKKPGGDCRDNLTKTKPLIAQEELNVGKSTTELIKQLLDNFMADDPDIGQNTTELKFHPSNQPDDKQYRNPEELEKLRNGSIMQQIQNEYARN